MAFSWDQYKEFSQILTVIDSKAYSFHKDQHWVRIRPIQFERWIQFLKQELNFIQLIEIHAHQVGRESVEVFYHLQNIEQHQRLNLIVEISQGEKLPSVTGTYPSAEWMEKELIEVTKWPLFNREIVPFFLKGDEVDQTLPLVPFNPNRSEKPYLEESYHWEYWEMSTHPELNHLFEAKVCLDGDKVTNLIPKLGLHRKNWDQVLSHSLPRQQLGIIDHINLLSAPSYSILASKLYEDMANIKIPERAQAIRMIFIELSRIIEHLSCLGNYCRDLGLKFESEVLMSAREKAFELNEKYCGRRHGSFISRLGGVGHDLPHGWNVEFIEFERLLHKLVPLIRHELSGHTQLQEQKNLAQLTASQAIKWGVTGPVLRASGINFDLRKSRPIYFYSDIEFDIPVGIYGTNYDRLLLRFEEVMESLRIIVQVIDNLPLGDFCLEAEQISHQIETSQVDSFFTSFEGGQGEVGLYYLKSENKISLKIRTASLTNAQALPFILQQVPKKYLSATLNLLGLHKQEIDR